VSDIRTEIRHFLSRDLGRDMTGVDDRESLLERGVIDSLAVLQLVTFLQERYDIQVSDDEMMPDNFDSIDAMADFVSAKQQARG
jgi:acyl carrier protein